MIPIPVIIFVDDDPKAARWEVVNFEYYRRARDLVTVVPNFSFREPGATHTFRVMIDGEGKFTRDGSTVKHEPFQVCLYPDGAAKDHRCHSEDEPSVNFYDLDDDDKSFTVTFQTPTAAQWGRWVYRLFINDTDDVLPLAFTYASQSERRWIHHGIGAAHLWRSAEAGKESRAEADVLRSRATVTDSQVEFPTIFGLHLMPKGISLQPLFWIQQTGQNLHLAFDLDTPGYSFVHGIPEVNPCNRGSLEKPPLKVQWYGVSDPKLCLGDVPYPKGFRNSHTSRGDDAQGDGATIAEIRWNEPAPDEHGRIATFYFALRGPQGADDARDDELEGRPPVLLVDPMIITDLPQDPPP